MKSLFALSGSLVVFLVVAAFNPDSVVNAYEVAKIRLFEMPRAIEDLNQRVHAAEDGDTDELYHLALYHISSSKWHWPAYYSDVLGQKNRPRGEAMMREAAAAGHPDALYALGRTLGVDESAWLVALRSGSSRAIADVYRELLQDPCNESMYGYAGIVREHLDDPTFPWMPESVQEHAIDIRETWRTDFTEFLGRVDAVRSEACPTDG
ncbi:MAG: hypothetical protein HKN17_09170 [Rhodothermales bacterium]|nr:hypothetical protein [Rhodothermales bacterium]